MSVTGDYPSPMSDEDARRAADRADRQLVAMPRSPAEALQPMRLPDPPERDPCKRMHPLLRLLHGLLSLAFIVVLAMAGLLYFAKLQFDSPGPLETSTVVVIPRGEGVSGIAERLEREGVITDRRVFVASILYFKAQNQLKAGEYEFRKQVSMRQVLDAIVEGKSILHRITIPEGLTSQQIVERVLAHPDLEGDVDGIPPEGTLLPDTYSFSRGAQRVDIIERMRAEQQRFLLSMWERRAPDIMVSTPDEALILASIVEKETGRADERAQVARVFHNRLKKNMRLQSDPTIIYGLVGGKGVLDGPITRANIEEETPYNTYRIAGLPPTPIANPGRASIEATLNPAKTSDLYFVADGTGGHAFAPSLEEHNRNVRQWRQIERAMREEQAAREAAAAAEAAGSAEDETETAALAESEAPLEAPAAQASAAVAEGPAVPMPVRNPRR
jgi:UPF0755 protein